MVTKPRLTVITINFNNAAGLERTLQSVRQQSNRKFEYIIVDGGSTDSSIELIRQNADIVDQWISERDKGEYDGMNKGIQMARGQYLMFLNSGDLFFDKHSIQNLLSSDFHEDFVYGDVCIDYGYKRTIRQYPDTLGVWFLYSQMICHQVQLIKAKLLKKLGGYNTRIKIVADYDFMINALVREKASYRHIPHTLAIYGWGGKSTQPAAAETIRQGKDRIRQKYFSSELYSALKEFDQTTNAEYQSILQSRGYQLLRTLERMPFFSWLINTTANFVLWLRNKISKIRRVKAL